MYIMFNIFYCLKYKAAEIQFESSNYLKLTNQYTEYIFLYSPIVPIVPVEHRGPYLWSHANTEYV